MRPLLIVALLGGCSFDWDAYDPRSTAATTSTSDAVTSSTSTPSVTVGGGGEGGQGVGGGSGGAGAGVPTDHLVAHWKLDEASGTIVADASGNDNGGVFIGMPQWTPGIIGGALNFPSGGSEDATDFVEIANTVTLENVQENDYAIAAWFKPTSVPPNTSLVNLSYTVLCKEGYHENIAYTFEQKFRYEHWLIDVSYVGVESAIIHPPGAWYQLTAVLDRTNGIAKLYVDGVIEQTVMFPPGSQTYEYDTIPWRMGACRPGPQDYAYPTDGIVDQVRIYDRVLSDAEVTALYQEGI